MKETPMRPEDIHIPTEEEFQFLTNADVIDGFLERDGDEPIKADDFFVLPDVGQVYTVKAVRFFKGSRGPVPYFEMEAVCAVEGCLGLVQFAKTAPEWRKSPYVRRTCPEHNRQWNTPVKNAWTRAVDRAALRSAAAERSARGQARKARKGLVDGVPFGVVEAEVMAVASLLEPIGYHDLLKTAAAGLKVPDGRDTRHQVTVRATLGLLKRGLLTRDTDWVIGVAARD